MSSFFQKARDRAQEAAAQLAAAHAGSSSSSGGSNNSHSNTNANAAPSDQTSTPQQASHPQPGNTAHSGFTYTGSLPHVLRAGLASFDPRFEATRSLHLLRAALKGVVIDDEALSRETKASAAKVFLWGEGHQPQTRLDGVGDVALVDVTDRLAYILSTIGDLEQQHATRLAAARANLKRLQTAELDLAAKRTQRIKVVKELQQLVPERMAPGGSSKATELQAYLSQLEGEAKHDEEALALLKRQSLQQAFDAQFDSYIQHGEKMALVASYGKLLLQQLPTTPESVPTFPADKAASPHWQGSANTAQVRALVKPALDAYVSRTPVPTLPQQQQQQQHGVTASGGGSVASGSASIAGSYSDNDTASFKTTHAAELERAQDDAHSVHAPSLSAHRPSFEAMPPLPEGGGEQLPPVPARPSSQSGGSSSGVVHRVPPPVSPSLHHTTSTSSASSISGHDRSQHEEAFEDSAPPGPTIAETGAILPSSPTGPGPLSGTLQPRRKSSVASNASSASRPTVPPRPSLGAASPPPSSYAAVGTSHSPVSMGPIGNTTPAYIPPPVAPTAAASASPSGSSSLGPVGNTTPAYIPPPTTAGASSASSASTPHAPAPGTSAYYETTADARARKEAEAAEARVTNPDAQEDLAVPPPSYSATADAQTSERSDSKTSGAPDAGGLVSAVGGASAAATATHQQMEQSELTTTIPWDPSSFLLSCSERRNQQGVVGGSSDGGGYAVVLLNQPISDEQRALFRRVWSGARVRVCADGGGNRLLQAFGSELQDTDKAGNSYQDYKVTESERLRAQFPHSEIKPSGSSSPSASPPLPLPDAVVGDLDSLTAASRAWYESRGVCIAHRPSQYATDLQKSIQWVEDWEQQCDSQLQLELVILGGLGGRQDQAAHTYHVLWKLCRALPSFGGYEDPDASDPSAAARGGKVRKRSRAWVLGEGSLVWLLPACGGPEQTHELRLPGAALGEACGILPFGVRGAGAGESADEGAHAHVWTHGLEWDLDPAQPQCLGGYLSTSNHVVYARPSPSPKGESEGELEGSDAGTQGDGRVLIRTDQPIFFSVEVAL